MVVCTLASHIKASAWTTTRPLPVRPRARHAAALHPHFATPAMEVAPVPSLAGTLRRQAQIDSRTHAPTARTALLVLPRAQRVLARVASSAPSHTAVPVPRAVSGFSASIQLQIPVRRAPMREAALQLARVARCELRPTAEAACIVCKVLWRMLLALLEAGLQL